MAQKHKAPTQVTLVQEEKGAFGQWIESHWKLLALGAVAVTAGILGFMQLDARKQAGLDARQDVLRAALLSVDHGELQGAAAELAGTGLEGWADLMGVQLAALADQHDEAAQRLASLRSSAGPLLTSLKLPLGPNGELRSILENVEHNVAGQRAIVSELEFDLECPDPAEGSQEVTLKTGVGDIRIRLFEIEAEKHVANFLRLASEGYYDGTRIHRIIKGFMVQGGDPNTRDPNSDKSTWGTGGPDEKIPSEADNGLLHSPFVLSAAKQPGDTESSGSQFFLTVGPAHHLDGQHTVYGKVIDQASREVLLDMARLPVQGELPDDPPEITGIEIH